MSERLRRAYVEILYPEADGEAGQFDLPDDPATRDGRYTCAGLARALQHILVTDNPNASIVFDGAEVRVLMVEDVNS